MNEERFLTIPAGTIERLAKQHPEFLDQVASLHPRGYARHGITEIWREFGSGDIRVGYIAEFPPQPFKSISDPPPLEPANPAILAYIQGATDAVTDQSEVPHLRGMDRQTEPTPSAEAFRGDRL